MKTCKDCKEKKLLSEFYINKGYYHPYCKFCTGIRSKKYRKESNKPRKQQLNRKPAIKEQSRKWKLWSNHRMTPQDWDNLIASQFWCCASCGDEWVEEENIIWHIDHDHSCCPKDYSCIKCRRGILCYYCNLTIGMSKEDLHRLESCTKYLRKWKNGS
jgi:Recombination endonuclease VII